MQDRWETKGKNVNIHDKMFKEYWSKIQLYYGPGWTFVLSSARRRKYNNTCAALVLLCGRPWPLNFLNPSSLCYFNYRQTQKQVCLDKSLHQPPTKGNACFFFSCLQLLLGWRVYIACGRFSLKCPAKIKIRCNWNWAHLTNCSFP